MTINPSPSDEKSVDFSEAASSSGLRGMLYREAIRRSKGTDRFAGQPEVAVRCLLREVNIDGELDILLSAHSAGKTSDIYSFSVNLRDFRIGRENMSPAAKLVLAQAALNIQQQQGGAQSHLMEICCKAQLGQPALVFTPDQYAEFISLPARLHLQGILDASEEGDGGPRLLDVRSCTSERGSIILGGMIREGEGFRAAVPGEEIDCYQLQVSINPGPFQRVGTLNGPPYALEALFETLSSAFIDGATIDELKVILHDFSRYLESPDALAGNPVVLKAEDGGVLESATAPVHDETIDVLEEVWHKNQAIDCSGYYRTNEDGIFRFLDVLRFVRDSHSIMCVGTRSNGATIEIPPACPEEVKRYVLIVDGKPVKEMAGIGSKEISRAEIEEVFKVAIFCFEQRGIEGVYRYLKRIGS